MSRVIFWSDMFLDTPPFVADGFFVQNALSGSVSIISGSIEDLTNNCGGLTAVRHRRFCGLLRRVP